MGVGVPGTSAWLATELARSSEVPRGSRGAGDSDGDLNRRQILTLTVCMDCQQLSIHMMADISTADRRASYSDDDKMMDERCRQAINKPTVANSMETESQRALLTWSAWGPGARSATPPGQTASAAGAAGPLLPQRHHLAPQRPPSAAGHVCARRPGSRRRCWAAAARARSGRASRRRSHAARAGTPAWASGIPPARPPAPMHVPI